MCIGVTHLKYIPAYSIHGGTEWRLSPIHCPSIAVPPSCGLPLRSLLLIPFPPWNYSKALLTPKRKKKNGSDGLIGPSDPSKWSCLQQPDVSSLWGGEQPWGEVAGMKLKRGKLCLNVRRNLFTAWMTECCNSLLIEAVESPSLGFWDDSEIHSLAWPWWLLVWIIIYLIVSLRGLILALIKIRVIKDIVLSNTCCKTLYNASFLVVWSVFLRLASFLTCNLCTCINRISPA